MAKTIMMIVGVVFIIIGILGFLSNPILGIFAVDTLHNLVHLISGILALIFASQGESQARKFAIILGVVYGLVTILGFLSGDSGKIVGLITVNTADNFLHLVLTIVFFIVGFTKSGASSNGMSSPSM
jgi:hypothetical protein